MGGERGGGKNSGLLFAKVAQSIEHDTNTWTGLSSPGSETTLHTVSNLVR
jgi:hypothetical protein